MLKRLATISLLLLFMFNLVGYRFVFDAMQQHASKTLEAKLDKQQYNEAELITISVPLSMPYLTNWSDFQRVDGEITLNGKIYHYVERKVQDGEMILRCLPDKGKMNIEFAKANIAKSSAENTTDKKSSTTVKQVVSDYDDALFQITLANNTKTVAELNLFNSRNLSAGVYALPYHPPCL